MGLIIFITKTTSGTLFPIPPSHLKSFGLDAKTIDDSLAKSVQWQKKIEAGSKVIFDPALFFVSLYLFGY